MKLTNPQTIQDSEKEFIDTINAELDWEAIEKMLKDKHDFTLQEEVEYKDGDLVVHQDQIAYRFDFEIKVPLSVIFNRDGDCLEILSKRNDEEEDDFEEDLEEDLEEEPGDAPEDLDDEFGDDLIEEGDLDEQNDVDSDPIPEDKVSKMTSDLADMISEINEGDE